MEQSLLLSIQVPEDSFALSTVTIYLKDEQF